MKYILAVALVVSLLFTVIVQLDGIRSLAQEGEYDKGLSDSLFIFITVIAFVIVDATCLYVVYKLISDIL